MTKTKMGLTEMAQQSGMTTGEVAGKLIEAGIEVNKYADPVSDEEMDVTAELAGEVADQDPSLLWIDSSDEDAALEAIGMARCECGEWMGERCNWSGPREEMVLVEWMPNYLRASHEAAGNRGSYPHNGSVRVLVEKSCAENILQHDSEWTSVVG